MNNTAKMDLFLIKFFFFKRSVAILKNSPTVGGKCTERPFWAAILNEKKGPPPYFSKKQDAKHVFF